MLFMPQFFSDKWFWFSLLLALGLHACLISGSEQAIAPDKPKISVTPIQLSYLQATPSPDSVNPTQAKPRPVANSLKSVETQNPEAEANSESYFRPGRLERADLEAEVAEAEATTTPISAATPASSPGVPALVRTTPAELATPSDMPGTAATTPEVIPRYLIKSPDSGLMQMQIKREEPGKNPVYGKAELNYQVSPGGDYKLSLQASLSILFASINLYQMESKGKLDSSGAGLQAEINLERRRNRSEIAVHFNRQEQQVSFSAANKTQAVSPYVHDKASFLLQLSGIALADPSAIAVGKSFVFQIAEEKSVSEFVFNVLAQEELETPLGKLTTWHLQRPAKPGSYSSVLDLWLAPAYQWYPVQIQNTESNGAITTQTANQIQFERVTDSDSQ